MNLDKDNMFIRGNGMFRRFKLGHFSNRGRNLLPICVALFALLISQQNCSGRGASTSDAMSGNGGSYGGCGGYGLTAAKCVTNENGPSGSPIEIVVKGFCPNPYRAQINSPPKYSPGPEPTLNPADYPYVTQVDVSDQAHITYQAANFTLVVDFNSSNPPFSGDLHLPGVGIESYTVQCQ
jgi:hypothetical protein